MQALIFARILLYKPRGNLEKGNRFKNGLGNRLKNNGLKGVNRLKNGLGEKLKGNYLKGVNRLKINWGKSTPEIGRY